MGAPNPANVNTQNQNRTAARRPAIPVLATLQNDKAVQEELKALEATEGPILLGISDELVDPAQRLLEPSTTPRGQLPLPTTSTYLLPTTSSYY